MTIPVWTQNALEGLVLTLAVPLAWKLLPGLLKGKLGALNEAIKASLRKTLPFWKGHGEDLKKGVDELEKNVLQDIDEVDKESDKPADPK